MYVSKSRDARLVTKIEWPRPKWPYQVSFCKRALELVADLRKDTWKIRYAMLLGQPVGCKSLMRLEESS